MKFLVLTGAVVSLTPIATGAAAAVPHRCAAALQAPDQVQAPRKVTALDIAQLRDIGSNHDEPAWLVKVPSEAKAIALSPDGQQLAFELRRAIPETNSYCLGMFVMNLQSGGSPRLVDEGGQILRLRYNLWGKAAFRSGLIEYRQPRWTPDGAAIYFLKKVNGVVQIWRAAADGSESRPVTHSPDSVSDYRIASDGHSVVYKTQPGLRLGEAAIGAEALIGYHYDDRFIPKASDRPYVPGPLAYKTWVQGDAPGSSVRPATAIEETLFRGGVTIPSQAEFGVKSPAGDVAWLEADTTTYPTRERLSAKTRNDKSITCKASTCQTNLLDLWLAPDGAVRYLRREGWARESTAIYQWHPGQQPKRLFSTKDLLTSCIPDGNDVICLREGSVRPRYIVRINLSSGRAAELYDPNPEFHSLKLGRAERLHWKNDFGVNVYGDLVLPVGYQPGHRYPLIVVQYSSRGFLRGGTGDEYPIQLYAANGYAVLSFNRPLDIGLVQHHPIGMEAEKANRVGHVDRRSVQSALVKGIDLLVRRGIADPERLGITGLSDGTSTLEYALINSHLFKAAISSSCCWDSLLEIMVGPGTMPHLAEAGFPGIMSDANPFWDAISIAKNAAHIDTPLLMESSSSEYLGALRPFTALQHYHQPTDLYVFPDETHVKWQPAHRLAIYRRSLAWFDFWLNGKFDDVLNAKERARWELLRRQRDTHKAK